MTATIDTEAAEALLREDRKKVVRQLTEAGADESGQLTGAVDFGDAFADAGAVTAERTEVLGLVKTLKTRLDNIDAALAAIAGGTYGTCERCGASIGADRMAYRPTSRLCMRCKSSS
jgi:RNA polymerase-binding transcription factor DksA